MCRFVSPPSPTSVPAPRRLVWSDFDCCCGRFVATGSVDIPRYRNTPRDTRAPALGWCAPCGFVVFSTMMFVFRATAPHLWWLRRVWRSTKVIEFYFAPLTCT